MEIIFFSFKIKEEQYTNTTTTQTNYFIIFDRNPLNKLFINTIPEKKLFLTNYFQMFYF